MVAHALAVAAVADAGVAVLLIDAVAVGFLAMVYAPPIVVILALTRRMSLTAVTPAIGWASTLFVVELSPCSG